MSLLFFPFFGECFSQGIVKKTPSLSAFSLTLRAHPNAGASELSRDPGWTPVRRLRREEEEDEEEEVEETPLTLPPPPPPPPLSLSLLLLFLEKEEDEPPPPPPSDLSERPRRRRDGEGGGVEGRTKDGASFLRERDAGIDESSVGGGVASFSSCWPSCSFCCSPAVKSSAAATSAVARRALDARPKTIAGVSVGAGKKGESAEGGALSFDLSFVDRKASSHLGKKNKKIKKLARSLFAPTLAALFFFVYNFRNLRFSYL